MKTMTRRGIAGAGALGLAGALAAPAVAQSGTLRWRMVTSWPKRLPGPGMSAERVATVHRRPIARGLCSKVLRTLVEPQLKTQQKFMEDELEKNTWFAGEEFTAADIQMSFVVEASAARGGLDKTRPKLMAWLERIHKRPAYIRALEKGGPYELLR